MASLGTLLPLFVLFIVIGIGGYIGYQVRGPGRHGHGQD